ncbi:LLM class flavin-dependent oxidoreductase [Gordonia terrae]
MTNYGHSIRTGVEISGAHEPAVPVELVRSAETIGYDVVVLSDSSGDAGFDALTLAAWTAGSTTAVHVVPRLDATARLASVVARATSSLQLLSGDRAAVALSVDPSTEVDAVDEALSVIRTLQDTNGRGKVSRSGTHHRLVDADPGPNLDRELPIWISGSDSTIAATAGRLADGFMADLDDGDTAGAAELNTALDRAATDAGRDPREILRAVTVPSGSELDATALVPLVIENGVSLFVLRLDATHGTDAITRDMQTFFATVSAARAEAETALAPKSLSSRRFRRHEVRARRRAGIGYDEIPDDLAGGAVEPGDPAFAKLHSTYLRGGDPGLVLRPRTVSEVASAVAFARTHRHLPLGLRSGGHGISGRSTNDGGLVIDVGALDDITVLDEATRLVRIGPGARWRDVATTLQPFGWALSSGDYGGVGVGGLATAGGIGFLSRAHGLTIDHLRAIEMVLADGSLVRATEAENPELFWAARGAGANFGVAVAFEFTVDEVDNVGWAQLAFDAPDPAAYLRDFGRVAMDTPRETTPFLIMGQGTAQVMAMVDSTDPSVIVEQLQPLAEIAPLVQQQVVIAPYAAVMNMFPESPHHGRGEPVSRSAFTDEITPGFASASADLIRSGASHWYQIRTVGGAVSDVPSDATAYAHRDANFALSVMGSNAQRVDRWFEPIRRQSTGLYLSFESDRDAARLTDAFPPATLERLRRLKTQLDPDNLFQDNFNVTPAQHDTRRIS